MVKNIEQARRIQEKRKSVGKRGFAAAVVRFLKREKLPKTAL